MIFVNWHLISDATEHAEKQSQDLRKMETTQGAGLVINSNKSVDLLISVSVPLDRSQNARLVRVVV